MKFNRLSCAFASIAALAVASALSGCDEAKVHINGIEGKPLSELDMSGEPPHALALYGPDEVNIREGTKLAITVEGDSAATDALRFSLRNGTLGIGRMAGMPFFSNSGSQCRHAAT